MNNKINLMPDTNQCIDIIGQLIQETGVITKQSKHIYALDAGAHALEEQAGNETYIRMLRYHVGQPHAWLFPDSRTKEALQAAENALMRTIARRQAQ